LMPILACVEADLVTLHGCEGQMHLKPCNELQGSGQQCERSSLYHTLPQGALPRGAGFQRLLLACLGPHQDAPHVRWRPLGLWPPRLLHGALGLSMHDLAVVPAASTMGARPEGPSCGKLRMLVGCSGASLCAVMNMHGRRGECSLGRSSSIKLLGLASAPVKATGLPACSEKACHAYITGWLPEGTSGKISRTAASKPVDGTLRPCQCH
jgi:hypothetical protein